MQPHVSEPVPQHTRVPEAAPTRFTKFAWGVLAYNLAVIAWGALVRATGSGAGCGGHWPLCNGGVLPQAPQGATIIEFTHRMMSGLALGSAVALFAWARRLYAAGHPARRWAAWSLAFMLTEALLGASLVLLGHVGLDESAGRVYSLSLHLINTFLLLASLALAAWWAPQPPRSTPKTRGRMAVKLALGAVVFVAVAGAITALGDTLFPARSLAEGLRDDFSSATSVFVRLRVLHPLLAIATALYIFRLAVSEYLQRRTPRLHRLAACLLALVTLEVAAGGLTVLLRAPVAMQLVHLLLADSVWITLILYASEDSQCA